MNKRLITTILIILIGCNVSMALPKSNAYCDSLLDVVNLLEEPRQQVDEYINVIRFYRLANTNRALEIIEYANKVAVENDLEREILKLDLERRHCKLIKGEFDEAMLGIDNISSELEEIDYAPLWGEYYLFYAHYNKRSNDVIKAFEYCLKALSNYKKINDEFGLARAYKCIGNNYLYYGDYGKAVEYLILSEKYAKGTNHPVLISRIYASIGHLHCRFNDLENSSLYFNKADSIFQKYELEYFIPELYYDMAVLSLKKRNIVDAIRQNQVAIDYSIKNNNKKVQGKAYNSLGDIYLSVNRIDSAKMYLFKSLEIAESLGDNNALANTHYSISNLYFNIKDYIKSSKHMTHAYTYAQNAGNIELTKDAVLFLSNIEFVSENYKLAYEYSLVAHEISDSIQISSNSNYLQYSKGANDVKRQLSLYESEIEKDSLVYEMRSEGRRREIALLAFALLFIVLIVLFFLFRIKFRKKSIYELEQKAKEIENHRVLLEISNIEIMEQYAFTETLLNTIPNPVFYTDRRNRLLGCNNAFEVITDVSADELSGVSMGKICERSSLEMLGENIFEKNDVGLHRCEGKLKFNDGEEHYVFCYRKGIIDEEGNFIGSVGILNDVSELKSVQESFIESEEKLKDALEAKDKFFNIVAHDLKNPFHGVLGLTMVLAENLSSYSNVDIEKSVKNINKSATQVYSLLENLLDWARAQSGMIDVQTTRFLLNEPILESIQLLKFITDKKNIKINFPYTSDLKVKADKNMILVVVRNILSNAVKYTPNGGEVNIYIESNGMFVNLTIKDNGVGISTERLNKLLHIDKPVSTPGVDNEKGTGLGLIICQEFVKLNGGEIVINSEEGKGTEFLITLPIG